MARPAGNTADAVALENALRDHPESFEFFEALRRLECAFPERPRLGQSTKVSDDFVRLGQTPSLAFAPRTVDSYQPGGGGVVHPVVVVAETEKPTTTQHRYQSERESDRSHRRVCARPRRPRQ